MKRLFIIVLAVAFSAYLHADISPNPIKAKGIIPIGSTNIQMVSEVVNIDMYMGSSIVDAVFMMKNLGKKESLEIGFPFVYFEHLMYDFSQIPTEFNAWINNKEINRDKFKLCPDNDKVWFLWESTISEDETVEIRVKYKLPAGYKKSNFFFYYLVSTGAGWKDSIESARVAVTIHDIPNDQLLSISPKGYAQSANKVVWEFSNFEPSEKDDIHIRYETNKGNYEKYVQKLPRFIIDNIEAPQKQYVMDSINVHDIAMMRVEKDSENGSVYIYTKDFLYPYQSDGNTKIIAHRGFWKSPSSAQNSITALAHTQEINIYGSEFDVLVTADGIPVVNHDDAIEGYVIEKTNYEVIKDIKLKNGERLPTLEEYLMEGLKDPSTRLVFELKPHSSEEIEREAVKEVVKLIKKYDILGQTDFISFSLFICKEFIKHFPDANVAYLGGNIAPTELYKAGLNGLDYHISALRKNPQWIKEAHDLGMTVNVWTVNQKEDMLEMIELGVDFITTDDPLLVKALQSASNPPTHPNL